MENRLDYAHRENSVKTAKPDRTEIEKLAAKAARGNEKALLALCRAIAQSVLFRVMRRIHNPPDAEDASQEVLIRVCSNIRGLREPKAFGGWLNSIIVNETNRYTAKNARNGVVLNIDDYIDSEADDSDDFIPDEYVARMEDRRAVMDIIDRLPERQTEAVMLHYYEGMSVTETAVAMGVTKQSVSRYLMLAREKIKKELMNDSRTAGALSGMAALPVGALLSTLLSSGNAGLPPINPAWIQRAVSHCETFVKNSPKITAKKRFRNSESAKLSATVGGALLAVTVFFTGLTAGGVFNSAPREVTGTVVFSGGEAGYEHLNPAHADVRAYGEDGDLTALSWKITDMSGGVLYSGEGGDIGGALGQMRNGAADGEYLLTFSLRDSVNATYTLSRSFVIRA